MVRSNTFHQVQPISSDSVSHPPSPPFLLNLSILLAPLASIPYHRRPVFLLLHHLHCRHHHHRLVLLLLPLPPFPAPPFSGRRSPPLRIALTSFCAAAAAASFIAAVAHHLLLPSSFPCSPSLALLRPCQCSYPLFPDLSILTATTSVASIRPLLIVLSWSFVLPHLLRLVFRCAVNLTPRLTLFRLTKWLTLWSSSAASIFAFEGLLWDVLWTFSTLSTFRFDSFVIACVGFR